MSMFKMLVYLYILFNIAALFFLATGCFSVVISMINARKLASAKTGLPTFLSCKPAFKRCCVTSSIFLIMDWILFSSTYVSENGETGKEILANLALTFAVIWAGVTAIGLVVDIASKFSKNSSVQIKDAYVPVVVRTVWCFLLTFFIA